MTDNKHSVKYEVAKLYLVPPGMFNNVVSSGLQVSIVAFACVSPLRGGVQIWTDGKHILMDLKIQKWLPYMEDADFNS